MPTVVQPSKDPSKFDSINYLSSERSKLSLERNSMHDKQVPVSRPSTTSGWNSPEETKHNNSLVETWEFMKILEAKLHQYQFQKVFCAEESDSQKKEEANDISGITNFSLEIEMLNKLHVQKNNHT